MKNFKKVISVVMALAMIISSFTAVSASKFADVADTAAYAEAVEVLAALGVVNGVEQENGTFNFEPEKSVTRAEAATMIVGALNLSDDAKASAGTSQFGDVNEKAAWAAGYVNVGVAQGFINGYDANTFGPLDNVTYAQLCVMLTQITGYGDYAKAYGGWPTGYTTMAANTGMNKGVAVAQDAALTKGQVAMMIWNALQTPLLGVSEYAIDGNKYVPQDGKKGDYKTLFTEKFNGFVAKKATIDQTPVIEGNGEQEVDLIVSESDWWLPDEVALPITIGLTIPSGYTADGYRDVNNIEYLDSVDVNSNYFHTGKAVFVLNEDEETVMIYFAASSKSDSKEFAADTYYLQDDLVAAKQYSGTFSKIRFGSSYYEFENNIDIYVNGKKYLPSTLAGVTPVPNTVDLSTMSATAAQTMLDDILGNAQGTIKILKNGTDDYNTIFVDYYQVAKIGGIDFDNEQTVIELDGVANILDTTLTSQLEKITIEDEAVAEGKTTVSVIKNGEEATLASLANGDIVAYATAFDVGTRDVTNPAEIKIIATTDKISGVVTVLDDNDTLALADDKYTIDGVEYARIKDVTLPTIDVSTSLDVTLDPFGNIYSAKVNADTLNFAIALKRSTDSESVTLLLADGTTKTYTIDSDYVTTFTANFATGANDINAVTTATDSNGNTITVSQVPVEDRVVIYQVSAKTGALKSIRKANTVVGSAAYPTLVGGAIATNLEYKSRSNVLGTSKILDSTPIINCLANTDLASDVAKYAAFSKDDLLDGTIYDAIVYSMSRTVAFVVVTNIGTTFGEDSRFAVAIGNAKKVITEDEDTVYSVSALLDGEVQELLFAIDGNGNSAATSLPTTTKTKNDGTVVNVPVPFYFTTDADGYVDAVYTASASNTAWTNNIVPADWSYNLWNPLHTPMQVVSGVVTEVGADYMAFAPMAAITAGSLDTTYDLEKTWNATDSSVGKGIVIYGIADDCAAYTYEINMQTRVEADKYDVTSASSIKASNFSVFDNGNGAQDDGIYAETAAQTAAGTTMLSKATEATAMIVDGQIVAIFAIER